MAKSKKLYKKLFISTFFLSAFTFGGGYVIVPLMRKKFVNEYGWIGEEEMLDLIAIAQSTPGAMAINTSIVIGYKMRGILGALVTLFGTILPPLIIISIVSMFYLSFKVNPYVNGALKGMQAGVAAVIVDVVIKMMLDVKKYNNIFLLLIMAGAFVATYYVNIVFIILVCGSIGLFFGKDNKRKKRRK